MPNLSETKTKEGNFVGPQIIQLFEDNDFSTKLNATERRAWEIFLKACRNFLGNKKAENYSKIAQDLISSCRVMGCNMSLKFHFFHSHLDFLPENLGAFSDESDESFHQDNAQMEKMYSGKYGPNMLGNLLESYLADTNWRI